MAFSLLDAADEADLNTYGLKTWLSTSSPWRKKTRKRLIEAIDRLVEFQEAVNAPNPRDLLLLSALLAVVLRHDKGFIGQIEKRAPANPDWDKLCKLVARALVQRWTAEKNLSLEDLTAQSSWAVDPDYVEAISALLELAKNEGQQAHSDIAEDMPPDEWGKELPGGQDFMEAAAQQIREVLEQHEDLAHSATNDGEIPLDAQEREIEKAALLDLRFRDLKAVAENRGVPIFKSKDRLVEAIVRHSDLTREEIAELVLKHTSGDDFERGMTTHLVPLGEPPELESAADALTRLTGKYAKLRVARWFVFTSTSNPDPQQLLIKGHLRGYRTKAVLDTDDYKVNATPQRTDVRIRLRQNISWAEVDARHVADVRDARTVLDRGAEVSVRSDVAPELGAMEGVLTGWDSRSVWFLDFLARALEDGNTHIFNFEMAHFERVGAPAQELGVPQIDKVELRGQHIGSHRDACSLITAGRRLLEIVVKLRFRVDAQHDFLIPVQISLLSDRATITTAAPREVPGSAVGNLHRSLVKKVRSALEHEVQFTELEELANKIAERAEQASPAEEADLFAPQEQPEAEAVEQLDPPAPIES